MQQSGISLEHVVSTVREYLSLGKTDEAVELLKSLHYADQAETFANLESQEQDLILPLLDIQTTASILEELEDHEVLDVVEDLPTSLLADVLDEMEPDEAADLLGDLPPAQASELLLQMEAADEVIPLLEYEDETAGGLMTTSYLALKVTSNTEQAIEFLRKVSPETDVPYYLYVTNDSKQLIGVVGLRDLVISNPKTPIKSIMNTDVIKVQDGSDQEDVARIMSKYDLTMIPVVNQEDILVGIITHDDILEVLENEATEDIYRLATVTDNELEPESPIAQHIKGRLPWLFINTMTAGFAAWVVSNYEASIDQVAILAVFQSIVAGQGGNSGSQIVTMIVRSMALGKLEAKRLWQIMGKQALVGILQGLAVGSLVGLGTYIWRGNPYLGLVVGLALMGNMILAGTIGTLIPIALKHFGQDPALASPILVTAVTDSGGFFIFFTLATIMLRYL